MKDRELNGPFWTFYNIQVNEPVSKEQAVAIIKGYLGENNEEADKFISKHIKRVK